MILGHSSVKVTERYAHLVPHAVQGVANAAQAAWESRHDAVTTLPAGPKKASNIAGTPGGTPTSDPRLRSSTNDTVSSGNSSGKTGLMEKSWKVVEHIRDGHEGPAWETEVLKDAAHGSWLGDDGEHAQAASAVRAVEHVHFERTLEQRGPVHVGRGGEQGPVVQALQ
jgi:hypothetical protein